MKILKGQTHVTPQRGMPVETLDDSQRIEDISGETAQFQYDNAGALGNDAGEAAGTAVLFKLAQGTVLNEVGDMPANHLDSSLSFTSTALTKEVELPNGYDGRDNEGAIERLKSLTSGLSNGEYFVDYVHGIGYGVKASTQTSLTATSYKIPVRGGSASLVLGAVTADITKINGTTVNEGGVSGSLGTGGNIAHGSTESANPVATGGIARTTQMTAVTEGQRVRTAHTPSGEVINAGYSYTNQNNRISETDPVSAHHLEITSAAVTGGAAGTYYYYVDMDGYSNLGLHLALTGTFTVTVEATIQDDSTPQSSCSYVDITTDAYGSASFSASAILNDSQGFFGQFKFVRVKVVNGGVGADDWTIFAKRKY